MSTPPLEDLGKNLVIGLRSSNQEEIRTAYRLMNYDISSAHTPLLPLLAETLNHPNGELRLAAAVAIERFGASAVPYLPKIIEALEREPSWWIQAALVQSLGSIPSSESADAIARYVSRHNDLRSTFRQTADAIIRLAPHAPNVEPALIGLQKSAPEDIQQWATEVLNGLRRAIRLAETAEIQRDLTQRHLLVGDLPSTAEAVREKFADHRYALSQGSGLLVDDYLLYRMSEMDEFLSRCRITIHRLADSRVVVAFIADGNCFNAGLDVNIENLATAARWCFSLDPDKTIFIREWHQAQDGEPGAKVITMRYMPRRGIFTDPSWGREFSSHQAILDEMTKP